MNTFPPPSPSMHANVCYYTVQSWSLACCSCSDDALGVQVAGRASKVDCVSFLTVQHGLDNPSSWMSFILKLILTHLTEIHQHQHVVSLSSSAMGKHSKRQRTQQNKLTRAPLAPILRVDLTTRLNSRKGGWGDLRCALTSLPGCRNVI